MKKFFAKIILLILIVNNFNILAINNTYSQNSQSTTTQSMADRYDAVTSGMVYAPKMSITREETATISEEYFKKGYILRENGQEVQDVSGIVASVEYFPYSRALSRNEEPIGTRARAVPSVRYNVDFNGVSEKYVVSALKINYTDGTHDIVGDLNPIGSFGNNGSTIAVPTSVKFYIYDPNALVAKNQPSIETRAIKNITISDANISEYFTSYTPSRAVVPSNVRSEQHVGSFPPGTRIVLSDDNPNLNNGRLDTTTAGVKTVNVDVILPKSGQQESTILRRQITFNVIDKRTTRDILNRKLIEESDKVTSLQNLNESEKEKVKADVRSVMADANNLLSRAQNDEEIQKIRENTLNAIDNAIKWAHQEDLKRELLSSVNILGGVDYLNADPEKQKAYTDAIAEANALNPETASPDEIQEVMRKITEAKNLLNGQEKIDEAKRQLEEEIARQQEILDSLDYTNADNDLKKEYSDALTKAKEKLQDLNNNPTKYTTQSEIDSAKTDLQNSTNNLNGTQKLEESKKELKKETDLGDGVKNSEDYLKADPEKQRKYDEELTKALEKLNNAKTSEDIDNAKIDLENAKYLLNGQQNLNSAKQAITNKENEAKQAINNLVNLTPEEKQAKIREIENKANEARNNIDSATNKAGIDTAKDTGLNELNNLIKQAKKEDLQKEVDKQPTVEGSNDYTNADQTPLQDKYQEELQKAKDILDNPDSTPEQIDEAKNKLREATNNLNGDEKLQTSKEALQAEVDKDKENTPNRITESPKYINADEDKKQAYNTALQNAKNLLDNKATPKEKEEAQKILDNPDSSPEDKAKAQETIAKPTITPEEVAQATTKLQEAENALNGNDKLQEAINNLQAEINKENTTKEDRDYKLADEDKKQAYDTALQEAKDLLDPTKTPNPTRQQLEQALKTLQNKGIGEIADEDNKRDYLNGNENLEQAKQELETLKQQKEQEVNNNPALTNEEKDAIKANLETALTNAKAKLDEANTKSDLSPDNDDASDNKFEEAKKLLDNVSLAPTTKPQAKEANSNLATDIKTQIDNLAHLTPEQKTALKNEVDNKLAEINTNIDAQTTNDDVATKKEEGLKDLQKILNKSKIQNEINRLKEELAINEGTANTNKNPDKITNKNGENGIDSAIANAENILNDFANKTPEELEAEYNSIKEKFVTWDTKLPEANITTPAQTLPTKDNSVNIVFTSEDTPETNNTDKTLNTAPKTGDISYKCAIVENKTDITVITDKKDLENNTTWVDCNSDVFTLDTDNKNLTVNLDNKSEKSYFIAIAPIDTAGNIGTPAIREIIYDKTPPSFSGQVSYSYEINTNDAKNILANVLSGITLEDNLDTELVNNFKANPSNYCKVNPEKIGEANQVGTYTITCNATDHANNVAKTFTRVINIFQRSSGGYSGGSSTPVTTAIPTTPATVTPVVPTENNTTNNPVDNTTAENANNITTLLPSQTTVTPVRSTQSGEQIYSLNSRITDYICPEIVNVYPYTKLVVKDNSIEGTFHDDISALMMFRGLEKDEMNLGQTYEEYKKHGVVLNVEKFEPYRNVTRAEFVKMLVRSLSCRYYYMGTDTNFSDVEQDKWYAEYIKFAVENGWINGYSDGTFRPNNPITRDEAAKILARSIKLTTNNQTTTNFSDIQQNSEFIPYIETLKENGIMKGRNNETFAPKSYIPRTETSRIIYRTFFGGKI